MLTSEKLYKYGLPIFLLVALYCAVMAFRPLLPVDETRYMSAAWEMHLRGDWLAPLTVNFQPYHHKPPLLFWLINLCWTVFGVSRWAGTIPMLISSLAVVFLTKNLAERCFPSGRAGLNVPLLMIGSIPFIIYSLLVMFDITLTVFVLLSLISLISFARSGKIITLLGLALAMGLGVLTKGPVAWLYVIFPILFGPLWIPRPMKPFKWYGGCFAALVLSVIPVLLWLVPVLSQSSDKFAYWLVWEQTAGRITGSFNDAHIRPVWFYLPFFPVLLLPWAFFPSFWGGLKNIRRDYAGEWGVRFLLVWIIPVFIAFSLISGKQPHYLVPLLPGVIILIAFWLKTSFKKIAAVTLTVVFITVAGQGIAAQTIFEKYDLKPITEYLLTHKNRDWAFVRKYHGELTFLGRLEKTVDDEERGTVGEWFKEHPDGLAIIRYDENNDDYVRKYKVLFDMPYRGRHLGVFAEK